MKGKNIVIIILSAVVLFLAGLQFLFVPPIISHTQKTRLLKSADAKSAVAVITGTETGNMQINNVSYHCLIFEFTDDDGTHRSGKSAYYNFSQMQTLYSAGTIKVYYSGDVIAEEGYGMQPPTRAYVILCGVFGGIGVILLGVIAYLTAGKLLDRVVLNEGKEAAAKIIDKRLSYLINGNPHYRMILAYEGDNGMTEGRTPAYNERTATYLLEKGEIRIRYRGRRIVIAEDVKPPDVYRHSNLFQFSAPNSPDSEYMVLERQALVFDELSELLDYDRANGLDSEFLIHLQTLIDEECELRKNADDNGGILW